MVSTNLMSLDDTSGCPFPFFGNGEKVYKIYNDGENYVATLCWRKLKQCDGNKLQLSHAGYRAQDLTEQQKDIILRRIMRNKRKAIHGRQFFKTSLKVDIGTGFGGRSDIDILFDSLYYQTMQKGWNYRYNKSVMLEFIKTGIEKLFPDYEHLDNWIEEKIKRKLNNLLHRKKRFRRKAYLNPWNYFVTFTYDDKKQTEDSFKKRLRKCLSNLHTRRGWKYMGVFEHAPETGRLHFHGLLYVPSGEMVGTITEKSDYSTAKHEMQTY
ncbi:MAG: hypothetical protein LUI60_05120, partial [Clostridia bacterium]|nr:hypothetical protein [Clostridia bacterium]